MNFVSSFSIFLLFLLFAGIEARCFNIFNFGHARITVLSSQLIRLEYSQSNTFRDSATLAFQDRSCIRSKNLVYVDQTKRTVKIETEKLRIFYDKNADEAFNSSNLRIQLKEKINSKAVEWYPQGTEFQQLNGQLFGTIRTLDGINGSTSLNCLDTKNHQMEHCTLGLISRDGYTVVDDSNSPEMDGSDWPWVINYTKVTLKEQNSHSRKCDIPALHRRRCVSLYEDNGFDNQETCELYGCCFDSNPSRVNMKAPNCFYSRRSYQDLYFFGYGLEYAKALRDFTKVSGKIPMLPYSIFKPQYSRWWGYNDFEEINLLNSFKSHSLELGTLFLDMDWHLTFYNNHSTDQAGQPKGWTGFTWNKKLFPSPSQFIDYCHRNNVLIALNLHPASGIQPWEDSYEIVAKNMGIDSQLKKYVPFQFLAKNFIKIWLNETIASREKEGVDFWWIDWQQGEDWIRLHENFFGINPTMWLNYIMFTNPFSIRGKKQKRPVILHRFGGLGNHRYPMGFSGDTKLSWDTLSFQPKFTSYAANVCFGYWSHDIGSFSGQPNGELYTRWVQWGVFSPIFRFHSTKGSSVDRRIWTYPNKYYKILDFYYSLRSKLLVYIYTQSRHTFESGLSLVHGLYYHWPNYNESYRFDDEYLFGNSILVAPITHPRVNNSILSRKVIWFPPGIWVNLFNGLHYEGPSTQSLTFTLKSMPVFVKYGKIIPLNRIDRERLPGEEKQSMELYISNFSIPCSGEIYHDDGISQDYTSGIYSWTKVISHYNGTFMHIRISLDNCSKSLILSRRQYVIKFMTQDLPKRVLFNGEELAFQTYPLSLSSNFVNSYSFNGRNLNLIIYISTEMGVGLVNSIVEVEMKINENRFDPMYIERQERLAEAKHIVDEYYSTYTVTSTELPVMYKLMETGMRISYWPENITQELFIFTSRFPDAVKEVKSSKVLSSSIRLKILQLIENSFFDSNNSLERKQNKLSAAK